jgi:hypothetical protein
MKFTTFITFIMLIAFSLTSANPLLIKRARTATASEWLGKFCRNFLSTYDDVNNLYNSITAGGSVKEFKDYLNAVKICWEYENFENQHPSHHPDGDEMKRLLKTEENDL